MSPNEFQLRAALHDGEGDRVDPERVILRVQRARRERRARLLSVAAAIIVVGGVATGGTYLLSGSHNEDAGSASTNGGGAPQGANGAASEAPAAPSPAAAGTSRAGGADFNGQTTGAPAAPPAVRATLQQLSCPPTRPTLTPPTSAYHAGPLFAHVVTALKVCGYPHGSTGVGGSLELTGSAAHDLAASLARASTGPPKTLCVGNPAEAAGLYLVAVTRAGAPMSPVRVDMDCGATIFTDTAIRYLWRPPVEIAALLAPSASHSPQPGVPPKQGSPAKTAP